MSNPFDTKAFKRLQETWYKKLEKTGFKDIEDASLPDRPLYKWDNSYFKRRYSETTFLAKRQYFETASDWGRDYAFTDVLDKRVWTLHCEGFSVREIGVQLKISKDVAHKIVCRLREVCFGAKNTD